MVPVTVLNLGEGTSSFLLVRLPSMVEVVTRRRTRPLLEGEMGDGSASVGVGRPSVLVGGSSSPRPCR